MHGRSSSCVRRTASNVLQPRYANCVESLCTLSREGSVGIVLWNAVWALPQCVGCVGHSLAMLSALSLRAWVALTSCSCARERRGRAGAQALRCGLNQRCPGDFGRVYWKNAPGIFHPKKRAFTNNTACPVARGFMRYRPPKSALPHSPPFRAEAACLHSLSHRKTV